ncbi:baseplate J/gp47 family protein [Paenibacillus alvei]|uniref:Baseplate J/gp47 family protein n=1 Tax=Paenibacillus alvei TaxID=44250 RepID=A0ABT4GRA8_PAEAL|nr:baseplate J/gp47 family protein [Paenibacillus alvei]MCY9758982.1 baseplate J/gp47 family protein [Paenibacillus alvei]MCY9770655.1 baseplate J/gp47 family protein [Paenibacillus alvei]
MLDEKGFKRMRYSDLLEQMEGQARAKYGETVNTSALSPLGIILRIFAFFLSHVWQGTEQVYYSGYRDTATGVSLDRIAPLVGIKRFQEQFAYGEISIVGTPGYTVYEGTVVGTDSGKYFNIADDITLDVEGKGIAEVTAQEAGSGWNVATGSITTLLNPDTNIKSITNERPTTGGRERETDSEFRTRFQLSVAGGGAASVDALRGALLRLPSVRAVAVIENSSLTTDVAGRPGKSFQCYVLGGDEQEIANTIFATKAGGIEAHGDIIRDVTDVAGYIHKVKFSRAEEVPMDVKVKIKRTFEFPADGIERVKIEIVQYIGGELDGKYYNGLSMGADVVYNKLISALYKVPGVDDLELLLKGSAKNVDIAPHQVARIKDGDIEVSYV